MASGTSPRPLGLITSSIGLEAPRITPGSPASMRSRNSTVGLEGGALNVLIPMGGLKPDSVVPGPLKHIVGRPVLWWLLDHLTLGPEDAVWIALPREVDDYFGVAKQLAHEYPQLNIHVVPLCFATSGPIETLFVLLQAMDEESRRRRTISLDSATLYFSDVLGAFRRVKPDGGASFYFVQDDEESSGSSVADQGRFSYIKMAGGIISDIREKVAISGFANTGAYGFPSAEVLLGVCEEILDAPYGANSADNSATRSASSTKGGNAAPPGPPGSTPVGPVMVGRTYVSNAIKTLIDRGTVFVGIHVPSFACVGRQDQLDDFLFHVKEGTAPLVVQRKIRFCFDLDETLVTPPVDPGDLSSCEPIWQNIELVRQLKRVGHHIIIQTARGMRNHSGNLGAVMRDVGAATFQCLADFDIPYDELIFGKPEADVYVGRKHVSSMMDTCKEIGWFVSQTEHKGLKGAVAPRDFNTVKPVDDTHVFKTGPRDIMRGEVHWYKSIPEQLADLFPKVRGVEDGEGVTFHDAVSIVMERVDGVTLTQLLVSGGLTSGRLRALMQAMRRLHACPMQSSSGGEGGGGGGGEGASEGASEGGSFPGRPLSSELAANYAPKVVDRYQKHQELYQSFEAQVPELKQMFEAVQSFLEDYAKAERFAVAAYIHGDPVFSNVILEKSGGVKLIDMRGALGGRLTTSGDRNYDLSKLFQSLCGYDFMLLDTWHSMSPIRHSMLKNLKAIFWECVREHYCEPAQEAAASSESTSAFELLRRDVSLITAAHYFTIVPLHETRERQVLYLEMSRSLLKEWGLL